MSCNNCNKQGISCPYTFMYIPNGKVPDPCPYQDANESNSPVVTTGYMQVLYPDWSLTEIEKELKSWLTTVKNLENHVDINILVTAEASKLEEWSRMKQLKPTITYTSTTAPTHYIR